MPTDQEQSKPLDLNAALNGRTPRSRPPVAANTPVAAQMVPTAPAAPIVFPVAPAPVVSEVASQPGLPVPVEQVAVAQVPAAQVAVVPGERLPINLEEIDDTPAGKKETFAIKPRVAILLAQLAKNRNKPKTYYVNKALEAYLKKIPDAFLPPLPDVEHDDE